MRLQGPAKAIDLVLVMRELKEAVAHVLGKELNELGNLGETLNETTV